jgi:hypothetical protein
MDYLVFTDESYITSQFQSISAFSLPCNHYKYLEEKFRSILVQSGVDEFKWVNLKNKKYYFCAKKIINFIFKERQLRDLRIDTIMWDMKDKRHDVRKRDDIANYERMFYHLLNNCLRRRKKNSQWHIRPDKRMGVDWATLQECLSKKGLNRELEHTIFGTFLNSTDYYIKSFETKDSKEEVLIQIPDLFAGLMVFSKEHYEKFCQWKSRDCPNLFDMDEQIQFSNSEEVRCNLLNCFYTRCKQEKLGVSIKEKRRLHTFKNTNPFYFWFYEPQGDYDKAPKKK